MKDTYRFTPLGRVLFVCVLAGPPPTLFAQAVARIDDHVLLAAIAEVETGTTRLAWPCKKIGKKGERSAWQFTQATWRRYTKQPFERASTEAALPHLIASLHLRELRMELMLHGQPASIYTLALAWNGGVGAVLHGGTNGQRDYACRVAALYESTTAPLWPVIPNLGELSHAH